MRKITIEELRNYFNAKAPKALREKGIITCDEYAWKENDDDRNLFIVNDCYVVRYIMRNRHYEPVIRGTKLSRLNTIKLRDSLNFLKIDFHSVNVII